VSRWSATAILGVVAVTGLPAAAAELSPQDFAYEVPIATPGSGAAYRLPIPLEIYRNVAHEDLSDVRVFNARGEVVPYEIETPAPRPVARTPGQSLPLFPLRGEARVVLDGLRISVQSQGTAVNVLAGQGTTEPPAVTSYVIDARDLSLSLSALELHWPGGAPDFAGHLRVESSDDLAVWRLVRGDAPVVSLHAGGAQLTQSRVEFSAARAKFWRLTWIGKPAPFELSSVTADAAAAPPEAERMTLTVTATAGDQKLREFFFDLGSRLPVNQVNVVLPEPNSVVKLQLLSRAHPADTWRELTQAEFFRVQTGSSERRNDPISIAANSDRYWSARVMPADAPSSAGTPKLQVSWDQQDLVFLARGPGPYLLAYGSGQATAAATALAPLLKGVTVQDASLGAVRLAAGPARLESPRVVPWKRLILWSVLAAGIVLLAWMAYRLSRELARTSAPKS
jgi:hypothetical protein